MTGGQQNIRHIVFFGNYTAIPTAPFTEMCGGTRGSIVS